jgi:hypothetical protein
VPKALLTEIRELLRAGIDPGLLAEGLGRRAMLDYGEIASLRAIALEMRHAMVAGRELPASGERPRMS